MCIIDNDFYSNNNRQEHSNIGYYNSTFTNYGTHNWKSISKQESYFLKTSTCDSAEQIL